jgi:hypothetical protein
VRRGRVGTARRGVLLQNEYLPEVSGKYTLETSPTCIPDCNSSTLAARTLLSSICGTVSLRGPKAQDHVRELPFLTVVFGGGLCLTTASLGRGL